MLSRTHLTITCFFVLIMLPFVEFKFIFVIIALIATLVPDVDTKFSKLGKHKIFRIPQFFIKHRGILHSFSFLIFITIIFAMFVPIIALGFFLGYGLHLFADSFTLEGVYPFYPLKRKSSWKIKTSGSEESLIFVGFLIANLFLLVHILGLF